jgi:hypothetical protein
MSTSVQATPISAPPAFSGKHLKLKVRTQEPQQQNLSFLHQQFQKRMVDTDTTEDAIDNAFEALGVIEADDEEIAIAIAIVHKDEAMKELWDAFDCIVEEDEESDRMEKARKCWA